MSELSRCPGEAALWRFFDGDGTEAELDAVGRHQEGCAACRDRLAAFVSDDSWEAEAQAGGEDRVVALLAAAGYEVVGKLGQGGMGVVYRARDRTLKRVVAVKLISLATPGRDLLARFRREAEAIARLQHPNIVQIHGIGECGGTPFFTLEYCSGGSLKKKLGGTPLPAKEAAEVVRQVALGVQAAHDQQVIHRDLKPANVLLCSPVSPRPGDDRVSERRDYIPKVADFGLAKTLDEAGESLSGGSPMGTPAYMAPEQAQARRDVGPAADIYALGAVLYECLTGRPPFTAASMQETLELVLTREPVPPRQLNPSVARDLETVCLACLRKEPGRRYPTAADVAADLQRFLAGEPIVARRTGRVERAAKWARRHPAYAALAATVAAAAVLVAGAGYASWRARLEGQVARVETSQRLALEAGAGREVLRLLDEAAEKGLPLSAQMKLDRARALMMISRRRDALAAIQEVDRAALTPTSRAVADLLEGVLWLGDDTGKFNAKLGQALDSPHLPIDERHYATGMLAGNIEACRKAFDAAVKVNPRHVDARAMLALCQVMLGQIPDGVRLAREGQLLAPDHSHFPAILAIAHAFQGDRAAVVTHAREMAALVENPDQARTFELALTVVADVWAHMRIDLMGDEPPVALSPVTLARLMFAAPKASKDVALPPGIQTGLTTWMNEYQAGLENMSGSGQSAAEFELFRLFFPSAKAHAVLTFHDMKRAPAARAKLEEYPEGTLKYLYANSVLWCGMRSLNAGKHTAASRDLLAQAGEALEDAANTPGLVRHRGMAAVTAAMVYSSVGVADGDHPGRPELLARSARILRDLRASGTPIPTYTYFKAVDILATADARGQALAFLQELDNFPQVEKHAGYYHQRAGCLHRLGLNEQCLRALAMIPARVRLTAKERAEVDALRRSAQARLKERFGEEGRP